MVIRTVSCVGIFLLLGAAAPATAPPYSSAGFAPSVSEPAAASPPGQLVAASAQVQPVPRATKRPRHYVRNRHRRPVPSYQIGQIRSQIANTVGLINQMDESLRGQLAQNRADIAAMTARFDSQARQVDLVGKRLDGIDNQLASQTHAQQEQAEAAEARFTDVVSRIDRQEQRVSALTASRVVGPTFVVAGLAILGVLLAAIALVISFRQRVRAVAQAENHADRLFHTYRLEFENLAHAAREVESRLHGGTPFAPQSAAAMHRQPEGAIVR